MNTVYDIRNQFATLYNDEKFVIDKSGVKVFEIVGACFMADEDHIFGEPNRDYIQRELDWYNSCSLNVNDIPGGIPAIWRQVADPDGYINSNYGWAIYSQENFNQLNNVIAELNVNPNGRRAICIYTRPKMWLDYNKNGMSDFMCTNTVQYLIRENRVHAVVQMRSNDAWAGYRNDYAWQKYVLDTIALELNLLPGNITWQVGSLHLYQSQFYLVDYYSCVGETTISKKEYEKWLDVWVQ